MEKNPLKIIGKHFGYPECCIDYFQESFGAMGNPIGAEAGNSTGFIPCPKCAEKVLSKEIELSDLIVDRTCKDEFPNGNVSEAERVLAYEEAYR